MLFVIHKSVVNSTIRLGRLRVIDMVPRRGLEPPQGFPHKYLKLACLPISPPRQVEKNLSGVLRSVNGSMVQEI